MMNKHRLSTLILVILLLSGVVTAVVINIDGSNLTPLSWFNSNKTKWDGNDTYFNYTFLSEKLLAGNSVTVTCYANGSCSIASTASGGGNASYPLNISNATGVLPKSSMPVNVSYNDTLTTNIFAIKSANQLNIPSSTYTLVNFTTENKDTLGEWNGTAYVAQRAGTKIVFVSLWWGGVIDAKPYEIDIYLNGVALYGVELHSSGTGNRLTTAISVPVDVVAGDVISVYGYHIDGVGDADIVADYQTYIRIVEAYK